eukprot:7199697-Pyramimonas_sp.AAC.1
MSAAPAPRSAAGRRSQSHPSTRWRSRPSTPSRRGSRPCPAASRTPRTPPRAGGGAALEVDLPPCLYLLAQRRGLGVVRLA